MASPRFFLVVLALLCAPIPLTAQDVTGRLLGRTLDAQGNPIAQVTATAVNESTGTMRAVFSDDRGYFQFVALPVGVYTGEIVLAVEAIGLDSLVVRADAFTIDPTSTTLGASLETEIFQDLPTERDYKSIVQLLPQANASSLGDPVNIAGSTGIENLYFVDGVNVTDVFRGRTGTDLPYQFVKAVEVKEGGYEAEYGQALGGLINVVTRSGTNDFELGAFGFLTGSGLAADAKPVPDVLDVDESTVYDVGVSLGGPIVPDRAWFFAAYNPSFERTDVLLPGFGLQRASLDKHMFAGKLTLQASEALDLELSAFGDPTTRRLVRPPESATLLEADPALYEQTEGGINASLSSRARLGSRVLLESLVAYHQRDEDERGATELGLQATLRDQTDRSNPVWSGGTGGVEERRSYRATGELTAAIFLGSHEVKLGGRYDETILQNRRTFDPGWIVQWADDLYVSNHQITRATVRNRAPSFFLQDAWSATDRLRVKAGVRWDGTNLVGASGEVLQPINDQWQPRIGITYLPGELGTHKVTATYSRFYQQMALMMSAFFHAGFGVRNEWYSADPRLPGAVADSIQVLQDADDVLLTEAIDDLKGESMDEVTLGYERMVSDELKLRARGIHRWLRANIEMVLTPFGIPIGGNRGRNRFSFVPEPTRRYTALELSGEYRSPRASLLASYVLSRTYGDYAGLFSAESGGLTGGSTGPNNNQTLYVSAQIVNAEGLLPNDRTHVLKASGSYRFDMGLTAGGSLIWQSGTPLSEYGWVNTGFTTPLFLEERGTAGRTPSVWDVSVRLQYALPRLSDTRIVLDLMHLGNPQRAVNFNQFRYNGSTSFVLGSWERIAASQVGLNPRYGQPTAFQPPFTVRIGLELGLGGGRN
jgi:hypothetical protein